MSFERNVGQHDARARFVARGAGYDFAVLDNGLAVSLRGDRSVAFTMRLAGAQRANAVMGESMLPGRANYFIGGDSSEWHTDVPTFARVRQRGVLPGVDIVYYGNGRQLEYDLEVSAGVNASALQMIYEGADALTLDDTGDLLVEVNSRQVRYSRPVAYQIRGQGRESVDVEYVIASEGVRFELGAYDRTRPLIIDPVLRFSTYLGGDLHDSPSAVAVDAAGNTYMAGRTDSADFPVTPGAPQPQRNSSRGSDAFITKLSPAGAIVYSTYLGGGVSSDSSGTSGDRASAIAVDAAGNAYVAGSTGCADFPVTTGAFQQTGRGNGDAFVTKLSASGNRLLYSTYLGGTRGDAAAAIAVDMRGFAYVAGSTFSSDFPTTPGVVDSTNTADTGFAVKLNQAGSALAYGTYLTGSQQFVKGIALEETGSVVVTGTVLYEMQTTQGPSSSLGDWDAFVFRLNASGTAYSARRVGGPGMDSASAIAIGGDGMVYVAGETNSPSLDAFHNWGSLHSGGSDAFYMRMSPGFHFVFDAGYLGGTATDAARAISVDDAWNVTVVGSTISTDFPVVKPIQARNAGGIDAFVTRFSFSNVQSPSFSTYVGGSNGESVSGAAVDGTGAVTLVGRTDSTNFPVAHAAQPTNRSMPTSSGVFTDGFVTRIAKTEKGAITSDDVVVHVANAASLHGNWFLVDDATAASGARLHNPNAGAAKVGTPLASPSDYFEFTVNLQPQTSYRMWLRGKAQGNSTSNDSVWVQFSNTSNGAYEEDTFEELFRIGTTNAMAVTVEDCNHCGVREWGWQDGGWGLNQLGPTFYADSAATTVRVQRREDGISIDQIVFVPAYEGSPSPYRDAAPGYQKDDTTILGEAAPPATGRDIVLYPGADGSSVHGAWRIVADATAAGGARVSHPNAGAAKLSTPLEPPVHYFDLYFHAQSGVGYRLWIRGKADANHWSNDSAFVQFTSSVTATGEPIWQIGSGLATTYVLEDCTGCGVAGWGWNDNAYGTTPGPLVYFAETGTHTIRVQTREDGLSIDQIVLSPERFLDGAPGAAKNDTTIVAR